MARYLLFLFALGLLTTATAQETQAPLTPARAYMRELNKKVLVVLSSLPAVEGEGSVQAEVLILSDGSISVITIKNPTGSQEIAESLRRGILNTVPLPVPPPEMLKDGVYKWAFTYKVSPRASDTTKRVPNFNSQDSLNSGLPPPKYSETPPVAEIKGPSTKAASMAYANTTRISDQDRKAKINKVATWFADMGQSPDAKLLEATNAMATLLTLQLGAGAPGWGPSNRSWKGVYDQVSIDIRAELERFLAGRGRDLESIAMAGFADALSIEDVDTLTEFSKSKEGKHYWQLSTDVAKLFVDTIARTSTGSFTPSKTTPSKDELKSWEHILKASNGARLSLAMMEQDRLAGRDTSGYAGIGILWGMVFSSHRDEFSRLATTYTDDLENFDMFNESPLGKRQIEALATSSMGLMPKMTEVLRDLEIEVKKHDPSWKQLYASVVPGELQKQ